MPEPTQADLDNHENVNNDILEELKKINNNISKLSNFMIARFRYDGDWDYLKKPEEPF